MKKMVSIILIILTICAVVVPASAATGNEIVPYFNHINSIYAWITIDEFTGIATCVGEVRAKQMNPVKVVVQLQKLEDGLWKTLETWTNTGTYYATKDGNYCVPSGYTYRTKVTGYIYDSDGNIIESGSTTDQYTYSSKNP